MKFKLNQSIIAEPGKYSIEVTVRGHDQYDCGKFHSSSYLFFSDSFDCDDMRIVDISGDINVELKDRLTRREFIENETN